MTEQVEKETSSAGILKRTTPLPPVPEGMSKKQWKKQWKRQQFKERKDEYADIRREKRKLARERRRTKVKEYEERGEEVPDELKRPPKVNVKQVDSGVSLIIDCGFDDLMNDKEIISLSNQITRAYSANRRADHYSKIKVTSFGGRLQKRFEDDLNNCNHNQWRHFEFVADDEAITGPHMDKSKMIYLTADTDEELDTLKPGMTYIIGGIVDKNRHKALCYNKAKELGITTKRLPIDEFIKIAGRRVLTTTHVVQLMLKYFDRHYWKEAFESILPPRIIEGKSRGSSEVVDNEETEE
ncbi:tRNA (guanine(9)-N(1))-methyltransferase NDAI_0G05140 [Naumovozyma dairenensis CBS 421]|uniref:tRNA (guanine(9)-N1)-methyltransferase n=1 Tax=Naumovozyma dairenensis (strain ATCC 10597 / BCRC 20456 / CBS 421 / NBRC 0211 / NRRL Y-12639) TaxID=1071378 RepID=J7RTE3_NAUDC|nr:hypothetical protein NDAI_0G05140 [Naumovozyma dairenensis CBS 421]CCK73497.1 hypothetical protein NDAI_0G05140 [Naumovozyma dairenensis CBS 421]